MNFKNVNSNGKNFLDFFEFLKRPRSGLYFHSRPILRIVRSLQRASNSDYACRHTSISEKGQRITAQLLQPLPQETKKDIYAAQNVVICSECDKPFNVLLSIIMQSASVPLYLFSSLLIVGNTPHHRTAEAWQNRHMLPNKLLHYVQSNHPQHLSPSTILKW